MIMEKPIIGIIGKVQPQRGENLWHRIDEVDEIRYLIIKNGGTAIMLLPTEETLEINDIKEIPLNEFEKLNLDDKIIEEAEKQFEGLEKIIKK